MGSSEPSSIKIAYYPFNTTRELLWNTVFQSGWERAVLQRQNPIHGTLWFPSKTLVLGQLHDHCGNWRSLSDLQHHLTCFPERPNTGYCHILMVLRKRSHCGLDLDFHSVLQKYFPRLLFKELLSYLWSIEEWTLQPRFNSIFGTTLCASQTIATRSLAIWWPLSDYCPKIFARSLTLQLLRVICHLEQSCKPHLTQQGQQSVLSPPPYFLGNFLGFCVSWENKTIIKKEIL